MQYINLSILIKYDFNGTGIMPAWEQITLLCYILLF